VSLGDPRTKAIRPRLLNKIQKNREAIPDGTHRAASNVIQESPGTRSVPPLDS
jgi:hypothetical protein